MGIRSIVQKIEVAIGATSIVIAVFAHLNTILCFVGKESCGMAEPLVSFWGLLFGSGLLVAGMSLRYKSSIVLLSHALLAFMVFFAVTID